MWHVAECYAGGHDGRRYSCIDYTYDSHQVFWTRYTNELSYVYMTRTSA